MRRAAQRRWQAGSLPLLLVLLLAAVCGTGPLTWPDRHPAGTGRDTALVNVVTQGHTAVVTNHADPKLLAKRNGQWTAGTVLAASQLSYRLVVPAGWRSAAAVAAHRGTASGGEAFRGRAPPLGA